MGCFGFSTLAGGIVAIAVSGMGCTFVPAQGFRAPFWAVWKQIK